MSYVFSKFGSSSLNIDITLLMRSTLDSSLRFDSRIYRDVNKGINRILKKEKLRKRRNEKEFLSAGQDTPVRKVLKYWTERSSPEELKVFRPVVLRQDYPVFFYLSLVLSPNDPNVFIPSPYKIASEGPQGLAKTIWLNPLWYWYSWRSLASSRPFAAPTLVPVSLSGQCIIHLCRP